MTCLSIAIRLEKPEDQRETELLTRGAFWDLYKPGCDEHLVVHKLRKSPSFVGSLDLVACDGQRIAGNIMYSRARVLGSNGAAHEVLCLGPVSVLPEYQRQGIGSRLIRESIARARSLGFRGIFLMGNPAYYFRFGFKNAEEFRVFGSDGKSHDYFMGMELTPGSLSGVEGNFFEDEAFHTDPGELIEFEKLFPAREKHITATQIFH
jgi:predicted N-acetyltransferase YhbS